MTTDHTSSFGCADRGASLEQHPNSCWLSYNQSNMNPKREVADLPEAVKRKVMILYPLLVHSQDTTGYGTHSLSGSWDINSVTYFSVAGMTPAAPFVLLSQTFLKIQSRSVYDTYGAVTTLPPDALTSFTYKSQYLTHMR